MFMEKMETSNSGHLPYTRLANKMFSPSLMAEIELDSHCVNMHGLPTLRNLREHETLYYELPHLQIIVSASL